MLKHAATICVFLVAGTALADDKPGVDPRAVEIASESTEFLSKQTRASLGWLITYDSVVDGRKKVTEVWTGRSTLVRGAGYRSTSTQGTSVQDYLYDGNTFSVNYHDTQEYASVKISGGFRDLVATLQNEYDFNLPMADIFDPSGSEEALEQLTEAEYLGEVLFGDQIVHHVAFRRYDGDWQIWVAADSERPLPVMIVGTDPYSLGWPQFQAMLYDWKLSDQVNGDSFKTSPPDGYSETNLLPLTSDGDTQ